MEFSTPLRADYNFTAKQNCSLSPGNRTFLFISILVVSTCIAVGFSFAGAWPVMPFFGLEMILLWLGFCAIGKSSGDFERVTVVGDKLKVERLHQGRLAVFEFNCCWAQIVLSRKDRTESRLWVRSHGKRLELGRLLDEEGRLKLAFCLREVTAGFKV